MKQEAVTKTDHHMDSFKEQHDQLRDGKVTGYHCDACGKDSITPLIRCDCGGHISRKDYASTGTVETFTIQRVAAEQFINDTPFAWVVVQLDDAGPRVTGMMLYIGKASDLQIGQKVKLVSSFKPGFMFEKL